MCPRWAYCSPGAHQRTARPHEAFLEFSQQRPGLGMFVSLNSTDSQDTHTWHIVESSIDQFGSHDCHCIFHAKSGWDPKGEESEWIDCGEAEKCRSTRRCQTPNLHLSHPSLALRFKSSRGSIANLLGLRSDQLMLLMDIPPGR